jgi:hypothetical protein
VENCARECRLAKARTITLTGFQRATNKGEGSGPKKLFYSSLRVRQDMAGTLCKYYLPLLDLRRGPKYSEKLESKPRRRRVEMSPSSQTKTLCQKNGQGANLVLARPSLHTWRVWVMNLFCLSSMRDGSCWGGLKTTLQICA